MSTQFDKWSGTLDCSLVNEEQLRVGDDFGSIGVRTPQTTKLVITYGDEPVFVMRSNAASHEPQVELKIIDGQHPLIVLIEQANRGTENDASARRLAEVLRRCNGLLDTINDLKTEIQELRDQC